MTQEPPNKPSLQEQLTDSLIKLLIAGSGGSTLYFLFVGEVPKALIAGAVATGTGLLTKFGEGLMKPLQEGMSARGEKAGKVIDKGINQTLDQTQKTLTNFSQQYLDALKVDCYTIDIEGHQLDQALALEDIFVPLRIESASDHCLDARNNREIWDFLPTKPNPSLYRRIVVLAPPGYGKSTLLRYLTFAYITKSPRTHQTRSLLPILLRLRDIHPLIQDETADKSALVLPDLVAKHLETKGEFRHLKLSKEWFESQLKHKDCLVMLDGLDEVPKSQRPKVRRWVDREMKAYKRTQFILTSRPYGFEPQPDEELVPVNIDLRLKVLDFTNDQKRSFIDKWYRAVVEQRWNILREENRRKPEERRLSEDVIAIKIEQDAIDYANHLSRQLFASSALTDLAKNPLLITMIAATHRAQTELPKRRAELYDTICRLLLGTRPSVKKTSLTLTASQNKAVLQGVAWNLVQREKTQFTPTEGAPWIEEILTRCGKDQPLTADRFWEEIRDVAGLLVEKEVGLYEFAHQTFQEYLAALYAKEQSQEAIVLQNIANDRWEEVICFYAALGNATNLINAALDQLRDNLDAPKAYLVKLIDRCKHECREVDRQVVNRWEKELLRDPAPKLRNFAAFKLEQRFHEDLLPLTEKTSITETYITFGEYQLFLTAQTTGQFHSQAAIVQAPPGQENQPVIDISWQDARWFCAWLSTQVHLQSKRVVYDYRLPTVEELQVSPDRDSLIAYTDSPNRPGNALRVVRTVIPYQYRSLQNYLSNGRWREANRETFDVMLEVGEQEGKGFLEEEDIQGFPCEDLRIIDQLWIKFSGGRFGFSVQKQIYVETGNSLDGRYHEESWERFCNRLGWIKDEEYVDDIDVNFDTCAEGHMPIWVSHFWVVADFSGLFVWGSLLGRKDL